MRVCRLNSVYYFKKLNFLSNGQKMTYSMTFTAVILGGFFNPGVFSVPTIVTECNNGVHGYRNSSSLGIEAMTSSKEFLGQRKKDLSLIRVQSDWSVS